MKYLKTLIAATVVMIFMLPILAGLALIDTLYTMDLRTDDETVSG